MDDWYPPDHCSAAFDPGLSGRDAPHLPNSLSTGKIVENIDNHCTGTITCIALESNRTLPLLGEARSMTGSPSTILCTVTKPSLVWVTPKSPNLHLSQPLWSLQYWAECKNINDRRISFWCSVIVTTLTVTAFLCKIIKLSLIKEIFANEVLCPISNAFFCHHLCSLPPSQEHSVLLLH